MATLTFELHERVPGRPTTRGWPSQALASSQLCRPHLRVVDPWPEIRLETSAVLSLAALSVGGGMLAVDGLLDSAAAGTTLDLNGIPIRVHGTGYFSTAFDLQARKSLTITITAPLVPAEHELGDSREAGVP